MSRNLMPLLVLFLLELILSSSSFSQAVYWQRLGVFDNVLDVKVTSYGHIFICVASKDSVIRSTDFGITWQSFGGMPNNVNRLAINSANEIYAAGTSIYKSTNNGETWFDTNAGQDGYSAILISAEAYVYAGTNNGLFVYSYDNGNSWNYNAVTNVRLNSIATCSNGQIFVATDGQYLFTSTDYGTSWTQIADQNLDASINSIAISSSDTIIVTDFYGIRVSTDYGNTWTVQNTMFLADNDALAIDSVGNILLGHTKQWFSYLEGVYKSGNNGLNWDYLGGPENPAVVYLSGDKIFLVGPSGLHLYDPEYEPPIGSNYLPLYVGNHWQFFRRNFYLGTYTDYSITDIMVTRDTIINNMKYYFWNDWPYKPMRYSDSTKIIYIYSNDSDRIFMDFNLFAGAQFSQWTGNGYRTVIVNESDITDFGITFNCKGYTHFDIGNDAQRYAENIGFYDFYYYDSHGDINETLISCLLIDSTDTTYISNHHAPYYIINPITLINTSNFEMNFEVRHFYSRFGPMPFVYGLNYVDSVYMFRYYSNGDTIINLDKTIPYNDVTNGPSPNYSVSFELDTMLMKNGFNFYYRFLAKDRALIPENTWSPDSGYYECVWDFPDAVSEVENNVSYSMDQNFPNPFNPNTTIEYSIAETGLVEVEIMDLLGRRIKMIVNEFQNRGKHQVKFDASELSSGIYFYRIKSGKFVQTKKMLLLK